MKQFNIKVANRYATVHVAKVWFHSEPDQISVCHCWNQMSSEKAMKILINSINIKALKRALIARRIILGLDMCKINAITKDNFIINRNSIIWNNDTLKKQNAAE